MRKNRDPTLGRKKKHLEFSKIIFLGTTAVTVTVTVFSLLLMWKTMDTSPLSYLIPSVFAEMATATGFYYRKAQKENEIKLPRYLDNQNSIPPDEGGGTTPPEENNQ